MSRLLMIDNYDSFTYNLVQYFRELGVEVDVALSDRIELADIAELAPAYIVISPGPGTPDQAGISMEVIRRFAGNIPLLGVCLGHQCIGQVYGGEIVRAAQVMHGKTSAVTHEGAGVFAKLPSPFEVTRYHSLVIERQCLPGCLELTAWTENATGEIDEIMGVRHRELAVEGVQFHPESILTEHGHQLLENFIRQHATK